MQSFLKYLISYCLMKKTLFAVLIIFALFLSACSSSSEEGLGIKSGEYVEVPVEEQVTGDTAVSDSSDVSIEINGFAYSPATIKIKKGTTVTWTNKDQVRHNVVSDEGNELSGQLLAQGESYSHTFDEVGTFAYHCAPHPRMMGTVIVE